MLTALGGGPAADEVRPVDVARDDVGLARLGRGPAAGGPLPELGELRDEEDAPALRRVRRLHDPRRIVTKKLGSLVPFCEIDAYRPPMGVPFA